MDSFRKSCRCMEHKRRVLANLKESSLSRKPSIVATECINLKSILGLTRQRSETNLSNLGLISTEPRRSRSEVRGVSCDRLTVGYHTAPGIPLENGKTRSSSPPSRSGWLRGRKREREFRSPVKNSPQDVFGKTVVTGSSRKRTNSKSRTIVDGSDGKQKNKVCSARSSLEPRKCKNGRKSSEEDIIEEEIYTEINNEKCGKLLDENRDVVLKDPNKVIRKKGMAPKPQVATALFKDTTTTNGDVNLNPNVRKSTNSLNDASLPPPNHKLSRKNHQTYNGRNQDKRPENRMMQTVKLNNLKNAENSLAKAKSNVNAQSVVAVAEIHKEMTSSVGLNNNTQNNKNKSIVPELESIKMSDVVKLDKIASNKESTGDKNGHEMDEEQLPFHIDTPDYSTLDSVNCNSFSMSTEDITFSRDDATFSKDDNIANCCNNNTDCDESLHESTPPLTSSDSCCGKVNRDISLSSILRDSSNDNKESTEPTKKTVRFEKLDLIEKYKKSKTENNSMEVEEEDHADTTISENKFLIKKVLDVNSNEISSADQQTTATTTTEELSQCPFEKPTVDPPRMKSNNCTNSMTVNVLVRNPSPAPQDGPQNAEDSPPQFVVKKSFVLTVAKQEKGFRSLCANKKPEVTIPEVTSKVDQPQQQISVTFLCSGPPSEGWVLPSVEDHQRLRSTSVPPRSLQSQPVEVVRDLPAIRGRSRDRRSRERQHCRKSHKAKKKEAVFAMPQAVIDELSQVLEKRKPSLDEIMVHP